MLTSAWKSSATSGGLGAQHRVVPTKPRMANLAGLHRRAATFVDKILNGAHPADLPWSSRPDSELVINMRTARALSVTDSPSVLLRADAVIQ